MKTCHDADAAEKTGITGDMVAVAKDTRVSSKNTTEGILRVTGKTKLNPPMARRAKLARGNLENLAFRVLFNQRGH
jgi:hypothetical protein